MSTTQPIREKEQVKKYIAYYDSVQPMPRNHALIVLGLHTALRISDLLALQWKDVYDFDLKFFRPHIFVTGKKDREVKCHRLEPAGKRAAFRIQKDAENRAGRLYIYEKYGLLQTAEPFPGFPHCQKGGG